MRRTVVALLALLAFAVPSSASAHRHHLPGCRTRACDARVRHWLEVHYPPPRWAIPMYVIECESHFTNEPPHEYAPGIDPSGYYQIISSTWRAYGGPTDGGRHPNASEWPRRVQDRIARKILRESPHGLHEWECA